MKTLLALFACLCCSFATLAAEPTTKPAAPGGAAAAEEAFVVTPMRVQEFPARTYFYVTAETTLAQIAPVATEMMKRLHETMDDNKIKPLAAPIMIYKGMTQDPNKPFEIQVGMPVADDTKEAGEAKVRQLEPFKAATIVYSGPLANVHEAWSNLFKEMFEAGLQYTGEMRDTFLDFTSPESVNNVQRMCVGVK
jgi:effector-binding domain-containing protein